ncbi:hypothetical protein [Pedobacter sp.]|uniref:hypothetical protein n=1 Tax=Pedobacter sp. TaxID=1411316 RepID=UPI003D7FDCE5
MMNNDKITELKELYSTAYHLNVDMIECLNSFKHVSELYFNAYRHFKNYHIHIFSDDVQYYIEEINELDNGVDTLIHKLQANITETYEMESYLFRNSKAMVN